MIALCLCIEDYACSVPSFLFIQISQAFTAAKLTAANVAHRHVRNYSSCRLIQFGIRQLAINCGRREVLDSRRTG